MSNKAPASNAYRTPAEAIIWICSRNDERLSAVPNPGRLGAMGYAMRTYTVKSFQRTTDDGASFVGECIQWAHSDWIGIGPEQALAQLIARSRDGAIRVQGHPPGLRSFESIPVANFADLKFRIVPDHPLQQQDGTFGSGDNRAGGSARRLLTCAGE
ncbi:MAG TPA: hypothetical protein VMU85_12685 [Stellaceae bacterium]|nr:hypothetical protein [Stellaceae bacterium]